LLKSQPVTYSVIEDRNTSAAKIMNQANHWPVTKLHSVLCLLHWLGGVANCNCNIVASANTSGLSDFAA